MKITNFLVLLTLFILTACGGNENNVNPEATLTGTWELAEFTANIETSTIFSGETTEAVINIDGKDFDYRLTFSETDYTTEGSYGYEGDMDVAGNKSSFDLAVSDVTGNGTYTLVDDELISDGAFFKLEFQGMNLEVGQGETKARITKLSDTELIISQDEETTIEDTQAGFSVTVTNKIVGQSVWKRK